VADFGSLLDPAGIGVLYAGTLTAMADPFSSFKKNLVNLRVEVTALFHVRNPNGAYVIGTS
jgi:hypothetical protein